MRKRKLSIRRKITLGYYAGLIIVLAVAMLTYYNLLRVDRKVEFSEVTAEFFERTLEARRFEKNYFLFEKEEDYRQNKEYIKTALGILKKYPDGFEDIAPGISVELIETHYRQYENLMDVAHQHIGLPRDDSITYTIKKDAVEAQVRGKGKDITNIAERISYLERNNIRELISSSRMILWSSLIVLLAAGIALGHTLATAVVRPLKFLERYTRQISRGEFVKYEGRVREEEVESLLNAFDKMTTELESRRRELVRSEKLASLGTLLSGVAHELNNPLSNISSSAQILAEEIEDPDVAYKKELIGQIEEQSDKAKNIVRTLLEFSREKEFRKQHVGLLQLLKETKALVRGQLPTLVSLKFSVPEDIVIEADKQRIQQVFLNLITNALGAVGDSGNVEVTASEKDDRYGRRVVEVVIKDDGSGIEPENLKRIFDPFFTTKDVGQGSGLGLFIVYDIIERHGGNIKVRSKPGEGTAFTITLPKENI